jgi:predicted DNA binding CopG/RHH family protein
MYEPRVRPTRPSAERPAALAKKFTGQPARLAIRVDKETLWGVKQAASARQMTEKRFVLEALQAQGAVIAAIDLIDDGE